jgi:flagellar basal body-associated protein FliL
MQKDNSLHEKFSGFTSNPDPAVWNKIAEKLDEKPKRKGIAFWYFAAALLVSMVVIGGISWNRFSSSEKQIAANTRTLNEKNHDSTETATQQKTESKMEVTINSTNTFISNKSTENTLANRVFVPKSDRVNFESNDKLKPDKEPVASDLSKEILKNERTDLNFLPLLHLDEKISRKSFAIHPNLREIRVARKESKFEIQLVAGSQTARSQSETWFSSDPSFETLVSNISTGNSGQTTITYLPIRFQFGILSAFNFSKRWRATSGVSWIQNQRKMAGNSFFSKVSNGIQIPLVIDYKIIQRQNWEWSAGIGLNLAHTWTANTAEQSKYWDSEFLLQSTIRRRITSRFSIQLQPHARFTTWNSKTKKIMNLNPWFLGGNLGVVLGI